MMSVAHLAAAEAVRRRRRWDKGRFAAALVEAARLDPGGALDRIREWLGAPSGSCALALRSGLGGLVVLEGPGEDRVALAVRTPPDQKVRAWIRDPSSGEGAWVRDGSDLADVWARSDAGERWPVAAADPSEAWLELAARADFGEALRVAFRHLEPPELSTCARVSRSWRRAALGVGAERARRLGLRPGEARAAGITGLAALQLMEPWSFARAAPAPPRELAIFAKVPARAALVRTFVSSWVRRYLGDEASERLLWTRSSSGDCTKRRPGLLFRDWHLLWGFVLLRSGRRRRTFALGAQSLWLAESWRTVPQALRILESKSFERVYLWSFGDPGAPMAWPDLDHALWTGTFSWDADGGGGESPVGALECVSATVGDGVARLAFSGARGPPRDVSVRWRGAAILSAADMVGGAARLVGNPGRIAWDPASGLLRVELSAAEVARVCDAFCEPGPSG